MKSFSLVNFSTMKMTPSFPLLKLHTHKKWTIFKILKNYDGVNGCNKSQLFFSIDWFLSSFKLFLPPSSDKSWTFSFLYNTAWYLTNADLIRLKTTEQERMRTVELGITTYWHNICLRLLNLCKFIVERSCYYRLY